jgi:serine/threonine protein phosphatase PrpC
MSDHPELGVPHLIHAANVAGGNDNITVLVAKVLGDGLPEPSEPISQTLRSVLPVAS